MFYSVLNMQFLCALRAADEAFRNERQELAAATPPSADGRAESLN